MVEQWYPAKYGRNSPAEEARQRAVRENTKPREETTAKVAQPANDWYENWYKAKFGRRSPLEDARKKAAGKR